MEKKKEKIQYHDGFLARRTRLGNSCQSFNACVNTSTTKGNGSNSEREKSFTDSMGLGRLRERAARGVPTRRATPRIDSSTCPVIDMIIKR